MNRNQTELEALIALSGCENALLACCLYAGGPMYRFCGQKIPVAGGRRFHLFQTFDDESVSTSEEGSASGVGLHVMTNAPNDWHSGAKRSKGSAG